MKMDERDSERFAREPYTTPRLIVHGSLEKITEGTGGDKGDGGVNKSKFG